MMVEGLLVWRAGVVDGYGLKIERGALVAAAAKMAGVLVRREYREDELPLGRVVAAEVRGDDLVVSVEVGGEPLVEDLRRGRVVLRPTMSVSGARWEGPVDHQVRIAESLEVVNLGAMLASEADPVPGLDWKIGRREEAGLGESTEGGDNGDDDIR